MKITCIKTVFYSAGGNTRHVVNETAGRIAQKLRVPYDPYDFTLPAQRENTLSFAEGQFVLLAVPVYAGRIPNKMLPFIQTRLNGNGALAAAVVTFGNRSYDNALIELRCELEKNGFHTIAAAAFAAQHAFSDKLASGRPDEADIRMIHAFADAAADKAARLAEIPAPVFVPGTEPVTKYYTPLGTDGRPAVFLKAKPKTAGACTGCGLCASVCPMGSIDAARPDTVTGVCIKCQACVKACPKHAKYFDDPAFLSHVKMLERTYGKRAENAVFV